MATTAESGGKPLSFLQRFFRRKPCVSADDALTASRQRNHHYVNVLPRRHSTPVPSAGVGGGGVGQSVAVVHPKERVVLVNGSSDEQLNGWVKLANGGLADDELDEKKNDSEEMKKKAQRKKQGLKRSADDSRMHRRMSSRRRRNRPPLTKDLSFVDISQPLEFPCPPELLLSYHKRKELLGPTEEWLVVELNEYECLVESLEIIQVIAKHSRFFEIEPGELWEEFFEFVEDVPSYDEIINKDVWQEFRDKKYPF